MGARATFLAAGRERGSRGGWGGGIAGLETGLDL